MNHEGRYASQGDCPGDCKGQNLLHAVSSLVKDGFERAIYYITLTLLFKTNRIRSLLSIAEDGFFGFRRNFFPLEGKPLARHFRMPLVFRAF